MAEEKIFTIPLRDVYSPGNRPKRANIAGRLVREFLKKHTKSDDIKIGNSINEAIWARSIQKPPHSVRVHVLKADKTVYAELVGVEIKLPSAEEAKKKAEKVTDKIKRIREGRKERKKETIQKELEADKGKSGSEITQVKEKASEIEEKEPEKKPRADRSAEARKLA